MRTTGMATRVLAAIVLACASLTAAAQGVTVRDAWARATVSAQKTGSAYMEIVAERDAAVVAADAAVAEKTELHTMSMDGGVMRMRPVQKIDLPAGKPVKLAPGGLHVMLIGLKQPLKAGDRIPVTLTVEGEGGKRSTLKVDAEVRTADGAKGHAHH